MNIAALRKRFIEIKTEATAILDGADSATAGKLSTEQKSSFDALMAERSEIEDSIKRFESVAHMSLGTGRATEATAPARAESVGTRIEVGEDRAKLDPMRGFRNAAEFGYAVKQASRHGVAADKRLVALGDEGGMGEIVGAPSNYHHETGSADGYMVPPKMAEEVSALVFEDAGILEKVAPEPSNSNVVELLADESTPWGSTGIQAYWAAEGAQMTASRLSTGKRMVTLDKLYSFVLATDELIADAARLQNRLTVGAAEAIRWKAEEALVNGDGVGKPLGWHVAGCLVEQAKEASQTATTVNAANVLKMRSRLLGNGAGAFWLVHSSVIPQLGAMTIGDQPVWTNPNGGIKEAPGGYLLGLPLFLSEHCQVLGTKGDIQLVQPKGYMAAVKTAGVEFAASMHLYFDYGIGAFRWTFRLAGQPKLSAAVTQAKGSGTLSHFITLATRS